MYKVALPNLSPPHYLYLDGLSVSHLYPLCYEEPIIHNLTVLIFFGKQIRLQCYISLAFDFKQFYFSGQR